MEAFEIAYDDETKQWIKRPCAKPREVVVPKRTCVDYCVLTIVTLQVMVGLWLLFQLRLA